MDHLRNFENIYEELESEVNEIEKSINSRSVFGNTGFFVNVVTGAVYDIFPDLIPFDILLDLWDFFDKITTHVIDIIEEEEGGGAAALHLSLIHI